MSVRAADGRYVARAELRLARDAVEPLREVPLRPDPLSLFARVYAMLRSDLKEEAHVAIDLLPASPQHRRRLRRRLLRQAEQTDTMGGGLTRALHDVAGEFGIDLGPAGTRRPGRLSAAQVVDQRHELRQRSAKLLELDAMFELQVLLRVASTVPERADATLKSLLSCFEPWGGANEFTVSGVRLVGRVFWGADMPLRRRWFDARLERGIFRPACRRGGNVVTSREIAGFLKPPTRHCPQRNVVRSGGALAAAPRDLPIYPSDPGKRRPGVLPLGRVLRDGQPVLVGMDLREFFFGGIFGRARFGKTELALCQSAHVALIERAGVLFFDPHIDAIERLKPYLTGDEAIDRVVELNLARRSLDATHVAWNLLSMQDLGVDRLADRAQAVIDGFAVGAGWTGRSAGRTTAILTNGVHSLLHLAHQLPPALQPTIFTLPRLLTDKTWRSAAASRLPAHLASYWETTYETYPDGASAPICQLISRLQTNPTVHATFGSPESTYDPRKAMDARLVVLACPPSGKEHLVSNLIMQGHIDAARSRADLPPEKRPLAYWWFDETPAYDQATSHLGTSAIAEGLEQTGKYGIRAMPMAQSPHRLSDSTIEALTTNASLLITTATSPKGARFFADQWDAIDAKSAVQKLERFNYIVQPTHHGRRADPFHVAGVPLEELWGDHHHPEHLDHLEAAIDKNSRPHTVRETLHLIDGHDDAILRALGGQARPRDLGATDGGQGNGRTFRVEEGDGP